MSESVDEIINGAENGEKSTEYYKGIPADLEDGEAYVEYDHFNLPSKMKGRWALSESAIHLHDKDSGFGGYYILAWTCVEKFVCQVDGELREMESREELEELKRGE